MIRVMIVDDEENALDILEIFLSQIGNITVVGRYMDPQHMLEDVGELRPDAVFLDIHMPGMSGMDAVASIRVASPSTQVVFTTAHAEHAVDAFTVGSLDYLLKPLTLDRLRHCIERIEKNRQREQSSKPRRMSTQVICMGEFSIRSSGAKDGYLPWRTSKEKELCAFLVHFGGQVVEQGIIMDALWPDSDFDKARTYLYTCVSLLRRQFREYDVPLDVHKSGNGYTLNIESVSCDWMELNVIFEHTTTGEIDSELCDQVTDLYVDDYMKGCDYAWALQRQIEFSQKYIVLLRRMAEFHRRNNRMIPAIECLQRLLTISPDSEQDGRELIGLHMQIGNRNDAIKVLHGLKEAVRIHLNAELESETLELYDHIVLSKQ